MKMERFLQRPTCWWMTVSVPCSLPLLPVTSSFTPLKNPQDRPPRSVLVTRLCMILIFFVHVLARHRKRQNWNANAPFKTTSGPNAFKSSKRFNVNTDTALSPTRTEKTCPWLAGWRGNVISTSSFKIVKEAILAAVPWLPKEFPLWKLLGSYGTRKPASGLSDTKSYKDLWSSTVMRMYRAPTRRVLLWLRGSNANAATTSSFKQVCLHTLLWTGLSNWKQWSFNGNFVPATRPKRSTSSTASGTTNPKSSRLAKALLNFFWWRFQVGIRPFCAPIFFTSFFLLHVGRRVSVFIFLFLQ